MRCDQRPPLAASTFPACCAAHAGWCSFAAAQLHPLTVLYLAGRREARVLRTAPATHWTNSLALLPAG